jgi:hypothetical protein
VFTRRRGSELRRRLSQARQLGRLPLAELSLGSMWPEWIAAEEYRRGALIRGRGNENGMPVWVMVHRRPRSTSLRNSLVARQRSGTEVAPLQRVAISCGARAPERIVDAPPRPLTRDACCENIQGQSRLPDPAEYERVRRPKGKVELLRLESRGVAIRLRAGGSETSCCKVRQYCAEVSASVCGNESVRDTVCRARHPRRC